MSATLIQMPIGGYAPNNESLANALRAMADYLENKVEGAAESAEIYRMVIVFETEDGSVHRRVLGNPTTKLETMGLLFHAATLVSTNAQAWEETGES